MHYFIYADKDSTIYSGSTPGKLESTTVEEQNVGLDSILELDKYKIHTGVEPLVTKKSVSRLLVNFNLTSLSSSLVKGDITDPKYNLRLYSTENTAEIPLSYTVYAHPLSSSWEMGIGKKTDNPISNDGVTWTWRDVSGSNSWNTHGGDFISTEATQSYEFERSDINMDVTDITNNWLNGTNTNYGFLLKRTSSIEDNDIEYGSLKFFSRDSHTVYVPKLEVKWRDDSFTTGSLSALDTSNDDFTIYMRNKKSEYKRNSKVKFRVHGRKKIVAKTYSTTSDYLTTKYLPSQSYYSIRDHLTDEVLIDFDDYTTISCDSSGNYFNLWMESFQPDRYYKIVYKVVSGSNENYFDDNQFVFKVVR